MSTSDHANDRELLEAAARAAGIEVHRGNMAHQRDMLFRNLEDEHGIATGVEWNPLTDDGDALRLAVKLEIEIQRNVIGSKVFAGIVDGCYEELQPDPYAATRRAIVRAAAAMAQEKAP